MQILTDSPRVRQARRVVLELLQSSVDTSTAPDLQRFARTTGPSPIGLATASASSSQGGPTTISCTCATTANASCATSASRRVAKKCSSPSPSALRVEDSPPTSIPDSTLHWPNRRASYCGNCVAVCPTGALMGRTGVEYAPERDVGAVRTIRQARPSAPYCGVGCGLRVTSQNERVVKVESPRDHPVTSGFLCVKGRFGYDFVNRR